MGFLWVVSSDFFFRLVTRVLLADIVFDVQDCARAVNCGTTRSSVVCLCDGLRGVSGRKAIAEAKKSRHGQVQGEIPLVRKTGKPLQNKVVNVSVPDFIKVSYRDFY